MLDVSIVVTMRLYANLCFVLLPDVYSLEWDQFQWTEIGDKRATALADLRVIKNFKTLK